MTVRPEGLHSMKCRLRSANWATNIVLAQMEYRYKAPWEMVDVTSYSTENSQCVGKRPGGILTKSYNPRGKY